MCPCIIKESFSVYNKAFVRTRKLRRLMGRLFNSFNYTAKARKLNQFTQIS